MLIFYYNLEPAQAAGRVTPGGRNVLHSCAYFRPSYGKRTGIYVKWTTNGGILQKDLKGTLSVGRRLSEIAGVLPEGTEVLISVEKLRGTDFWVGAIDATTWRHTRINPLSHRMYKSPPALSFGLAYSIGTRQSGKPCGAPIALRALI